MCAIRQRDKQCPGAVPLHRIGGGSVSLPTRRAGNVYPLRAENC